MKDVVNIYNNGKYIWGLGIINVAFLIMIISSLIDNKPVRFWQGVFYIFATLSIISFIIQVILMHKNKK